MPRPHRAGRILAAVLFVGLGVVVVSGGGGALSTLNERLAGGLSAGPAGVGAFVLLAALSVLLSVFSSAPIVPAAVLTWGAWPTTVLLLAGWLVGGVGAYAIGRFGGRRLLGRFASLERLDAWVSVLPRTRALVVATLVRMTFPSEVAYLFGLARFAFGPFLLLTLLAELPTAILLVFASDALNDRRFVTFGVVSAAGLVLALVGWSVRRRLLHRDREPPTASDRRRRPFLRLRRA